MNDSTTETQRVQTQRLRLVAEEAQARFAETHRAREHALALSRQVIRNSANSIRSTHRGEFEEARRTLFAAGELAKEFTEAKEAHPAVYYAGFVEDALKEYVEASVTLAFVEGTKLPDPQELNVRVAPYLNGLAESVGELRRFILDGLRREDFSRCEELLEVMDEVYSILVSMDFPEAVTRGLRRSTDMVRGVLERTRGDLTMALRQRRLEQKLAAMQGSLVQGEANEA